MKIHEPTGKVPEQMVGVYIIRVGSEPKVMQRRKPGELTWTYFTDKMLLLWITITEQTIGNDEIIENSHLSN